MPSCAVIVIFKVVTFPLFSVTSFWILPLFSPTVSIVTVACASVALMYIFAFVAFVVVTE